MRQPRGSSESWELMLPPLAGGTKLWWWYLTPGLGSQLRGWGRSECQGWRQKWWRPQYTAFFPGNAVLKISGLSPGAAPTLTITLDF